MQQHLHQNVPQTDMRVKLKIHKLIAYFLNPKVRIVYYDYSHPSASIIIEPKIEVSKKYLITYDSRDEAR